MFFICFFYCVAFFLRNQIKITSKKEEPKTFNRSKMILIFIWFALFDSIYDMRLARKKWKLYFYRIDFVSGSIAKITVDHKPSAWKLVMKIANKSKWLFMTNRLWLVSRQLWFFSGFKFGLDWTINQRILTARKEFMLWQMVFFSCGEKWVQET